MKKVILDTDTFNEADDLFALSYLLKNKDKFDIKAITLAPFKHSGYNKSVFDSIDIFAYILKRKRNHTKVSFSYYLL